MHIGNSVICPVTGIPMLILMGAGIYYAVKKIKSENKTSNVKLSTFISLSMLVFALQMINFSIPSTGSSGHIIGTVLLAALLSPSLAFIAMTCILIIQSLFFADGGLLALGCNIFNMAFIPCFIVYPLIYNPLKNKPLSACLLSSAAALELGAFAAAVEIWLSGSLSGNFANFLSLMQMIHIPISIIEGIFTYAIVILMIKTSFKKYSTVSFCALSAVFAGIIAKYASTKPDGLEWSLLNISDSIVFQTRGLIYTLSETLQNKIAILANIEPLTANITGLILISLLITFIGKKLCLETVNVNDKQ